MPVRGVFLDLQKDFDTVNHSILLKKLYHYGIGGVAINWFCLFLSDRMQLTSINKTQSDKREMKYGVPQGSVPGPLLFISFINDLDKVVEFSTVHHFTDDTNMLLIEKSLKKMNRYINRDLKPVIEWIRANNLSLKVVSATFLLVCFVCLKDSTCETRKNVFYFTLKALFVLETIKF